MKVILILVLMCVCVCVMCINNIIININNVCNIINVY